MNLPRILIAGLTFLTAALPAAYGDLFRMADGSQRIGRIVAQETNYLSVMIDVEGMRSIVRIPRSELYYIVPAGTTDPLTGQLAPPTRAMRPITFLSDVPETIEKSPENSSTTQSGTIILRGPATTKSAASQPTKKLVPASPEFFAELGRLLAGQGGDLGDPSTLSTQSRKNWDALLAADTAGDKKATLENMTALAKAYDKQPARLNLLAMRTKGIPFSIWMAQTRWDIWMLPPRRPMFDLSSVTEIERPELIRLLRSKTQESLEPLKQYFPPERVRTATSGPAAPVQFNPNANTGMGAANNPLNGITVSNTLEVREKAYLASAVLTAQLKLEPDMPNLDRLFLAEQARNVQAILARVSQTLPGALAAKEKADREKRIADEKAARQPR